METERAKRLAEFVAWVGADIKGDEKGEAQLFLDRLFRGFGHDGVPEAAKVKWAVDDHNQAVTA